MSGVGEEARRARSHAASRTATAITPATRWRSARSSGAHVVAPYEVSVWLQQKGLKNVTGMNPGGTLKVLGLSITMVPAVHSSSVEEDGQIIYLGVATGYVITFEDGLTIYFAGDTSIFGDMRLIGEIYQPVDRLSADRRPLYDGPRAGGEGVRAARRQAGRADALRHVPGAHRHAGEAARARRAERRAGAGAQTRRDCILAKADHEGTEDSRKNRFFFVSSCLRAFVVAFEVYDDDSSDAQAALHQRRVARRRRRARRSRSSTRRPKK